MILWVVFWWLTAVFCGAIAFMSHKRVNFLQSNPGWDQDPRYSLLNLARTRVWLFGIAAWFSLGAVVELLTGTPK
jgi:hypothetical protein